MSDIRTLAIDIGGTGLKASVLDTAGQMLHEKAWRKTPHEITPDGLVSELRLLIEPLPDFDRISVGFPGQVRKGHVLTAPHFPEGDWHGFDLAGAIAAAMGKPTRLGNDADIQGMGVVRGEGLEFVLTLGTGAGTAFFEDGRIAPHMEFAHHPVHKKYSYNEYIGRDALADVGHKRWNRRVQRVIGIIDRLVNFDHLYIGGGNGRRVEGDLGNRVTVVPNEAGITGGIALWKEGDANRWSSDKQPG